MRTLLRIIAFAFFAWLAVFPAFAQGARHNDIALGRDGHIAPGASVAVCTSQGIIGYGNSPCSPLATIYTDATLATPAPNPFVADSNGDYGFWAAPGTYEVQIYGPQIGTYIQTVTIPCVPNTSATGCGSAATEGNNTWTGTNTFTADALFKSGDPWFDVKAFGAKCDDVADDTTALQAALAAVPPTGGLIEIPGICKFTQTLTIATPNVTIAGKGHFQFITQNAPVTYLDYQGASGNAIVVAAQGFKMQDVGVKYPSTIGGPLAPPASPTLSQVTGSGCPAEPYYVQTTYVSALGQTVDSPEATYTTTSGNCLQVASPAAEAGATDWNVYVSANPNNETKQTASPLAIGTNWTFTGTLANLGFRPPVDTTAFAAIYDPNGAQLDGVKLFTALTFGTASTANGYTSVNCCGKLHNVYIAGFGNGILGAGSNNDFSVTDSYIQNNYVGAFIVNGADINLVRNDFEGNVVGNVKMLYGSPYTISQNYFEEESSPPSYNVQIGDSTIPPQGFTPTPGAIIIEGNFMQCNLTTYPPAPIVVDTSAVLDIERNSFSQCGNEDIVDNKGGTSGHIKILGNISDAVPVTWLTSTTGVDESDFLPLQELPGTPSYYGLNIDSASGTSALLFRSSGANVWNLNATPTAFSLGFNAHSGESTLQIEPFGSQSYASVKSNYAMTAAEEIVTPSGTPTFDAGLGNTFELTMSANVTSSTLVNAQAGEWLAFIICQGTGGPYTFTWPSNVLGGGTVGSVGGNCSTQSFYVSGGNAWATGPMMTNLSTGLSGLSLPAAAGTVPYFTGAWTNDDCLEAGGSTGLITVTGSACGSGGGGTVDVNGSAISSPNFNGTTPAAGTGFTNATFQVSGSSVSVEVPTSSAAPGGTSTAVQFNNSGALAGDATNFFFNDTTHALTITGPFTASTLTLTSQNTFTLGSGSQTNASYFYAQSGSGSTNTTPAYLELSGSPANAFNSFLFPCQTAGNFCEFATTPSADSNKTLVVHGGLNAQTGATYTIVVSDEDGLTTFNNASAIAVTLPCPSATAFQNGWREMVKMTGVGTPTITTSGCNINGATTFAIPAAGVWLISDGSNYWTVQ